MATTAEDFRELLNAETHIDMEKLRQFSKHGIPDEVRGDAWRYLLGVEQPNKTNEISTLKTKYEDYKQNDKINNELLKPIRGEASRYNRSKEKFFKSKNLTQTLENVISIYINHNRTVDYNPAFIHLCGPFVYSYNEEYDVYYSFERLMILLDEYNTFHDINERLARFLMRFRMILPDLYNHFEEEEVDFKEWTSSWLRYLLAKELPLDCLVRLWDTYFSIEEGFDLHFYVCLAILKYFKEALEECESSEIRALLLRLPAMDMDKIISQAFTIKNEIMAEQLLEPY